MEKKDEQIRDAFMSMLCQACGDWDHETGRYTFDSMCLSSYEGALDLAVELGWIKKAQVVR